MPATTTTPFNSTDSRRTSIVTDLWNPATGRFDPVRLRWELVRRGLTVDQFAKQASCGRSSMYKALRGEGVRDRTAIAILEALARIPPRWEVA